MKLTFFLIVIGVFQSIASGMAQTISLRAKDMTLVEAMRSIQQQSGHRFFLNGKNLAEIRVDADLKDVSLAEAMNVLLQNKPAEWLLENETIVIKNPPSDQIPLIVSLPAGNATLSNAGTPQEHVVTGSITDERGEPLMGVTITLKGTQTSTFSDNKGVYSISMTGDGPKVLVYTMLGHETVEQVVGTRRLINVSMRSLLTSVDEVVVLGYGGQSTRRTTTDATARVDSLLFQENAASSVIEIIQGQVPGMMTMMGSGAPGEEPLTIIRGVSSLEGNLGPLIVIDDIPMDEEFSFNDINPNDIVSIDILKGASASSIYGSRGAGGVFMITTKNGFNSPPSISYRLNYGRVVLTEPMEFLDTDEFKTLFVEALWNRVREENLTGTGVLRHDITLWSSIYNNTMVNDFWGEANTDWLGLLYQPATRANHNLNISGRAQGGVGYTLGLGYTDEIGQVIGSGYKRYNLDFKLDSRQSEIFQYGIILSGSSQNREDSPVTLSSALSMRPDMPPYNEDGTPYVPANATTSSFRNPLVDLEGTDLNNINFRYRTAAYIQINPGIAGLSWKTLGSLNNSLLDRSRYYGSNTATGSNNWNVNIPRSGRRIESMTNTKKVEVDSRVNFRRTFARLHSLDAVAAINYTRDSRYFENRTIDDFPEDNYLNAVFHGINPLPASGSAWNASLLSFIVRANYAYNREYMLTLSMRRDGTSRMAPGSRYANFPSAAVAWNLGENPWFKSVFADNINMLKFRASLGRTANAAVPAYGWMTTFSAAMYNDQTAIVPTRVANDQLEWETSTQYDLGVDFSILSRGMIEGSFNYYKKMTRGALNSYSLPMSAGLTSTSTLANLVDIDNQGVELDLQIQAIRKRNWNWVISGNIARNTNVLKRMDTNIRRLSAHAKTILQVGQPIGLHYGFVTDGLFDSWEEVAYYHSLNPYWQYQAFHMAPGEIILKDNNGNGWVEFGTGSANHSEEERRVLGKSYPDFFGGVSSRLRYKQFTLTAQGSYSVGNSKNWSLMENQFQFNGTRPINLLKINLNRWTPDRPDAPYPKMLMNPANSTIAFGRALPLTQYFHDFWVYDASYFKINNLGLTYAPTSQQLNRYLPVLSRASLGFSVNNVFLFTKYPGVNPEAYSSTDRIAGPAEDRSAYPKTRTYSLSLNVTFKQ